MQVKRKFIVRIILGLVAVWLLLLGLVYFSTGKYRDHAITMLKTQLDKNLLTAVQIRKDDIHLSLLKNFPYATITLEDIYVQSAPGPDYSEFSPEIRDTLLFAHKLSFSVNLWALISKKYELKRIEVENARLNLLRDSEGVVNYAIWRSDASSDTTELTINLRKIDLQQVALRYRDTKTEIDLISLINKAVLSGNFNRDDYEFEIKAEGEQSSLKMGDSHYVVPGKLPLKTLLKQQEGVYTFTDIESVLYGIQLTGTGFYKDLNSEYRFNFISRSASLQRLDSYFLKTYLDEVEIQSPRGQFDLDLELAGQSGRDASINMNFSTRDASAYLPKYDIKLSNLLYSGRFTNGSAQRASTSQLLADTLYVRSDKSELSFTGVLSNFSAPYLEGKLSCNLQAAKLVKLADLNEKYDASGHIGGEIYIKGKMPVQNKTRPDDLKKVHLNGILNLADLSFRSLSSGLPAATLNGNIKLHTLADIDIEQVHLSMGNSSLYVSGSVTDIPFFTADKSRFPVYSCIIRAEEFHVDDFLKNTADDNEPQAYELPDSMLLNADITMDKFYFGKFQAQQVSGHIEYVPLKLSISGFTMQSQGGQITSDMKIYQAGKYLITEGTSHFSKVDMGDLFEACNEFNQDVITHEHIDGKLSGEAYLSASWDPMLNPVYERLYLTSELVIENGELINYQPMLALSDFIAVEELKHIRFDRLVLNVGIEEQTVKIAQTTINSSAISLLGSGQHNFKNEYTYRFQVQLADVLWKKARKKRPQNTEFGYVVDDGLGRTTIPLKIVGLGEEFSVSYDKRTAGSVLRRKLQEEKQEWKDLTSDKEKEELPPPTPIYWEEDEHSNRETKPVKKDSIKKKDDSDGEFLIDWDDE